jgi:hypothetical protein
MPTPRYDYNKSSQDIIRDLIYSSNGFMLPATGVLYGIPSAITPLVADRYQRDTLIQLSMDPSIPSKLFRGSRSFLYKRIDLAQLIPVAATPVPIQVASFPTDTYTLLAQINAYYGLKLSYADVQNITYTSIVGAIMAATLGSLAFEGNCTLNLQLAAPPAP